MVTPRTGSSGISQGDRPQGPPRATPDAAGARGPVVFLSALEPSADLHAAELITAIQRRCPDARFIGLGGPRMRAAGCETLCDITGRSAMLLSAVRIAGDALRLLQRVDRFFAAGGADVFVPVDSPTFNLPLARRAKARRLPVVYYIAPQVWAWAEFRLRKVRQRTDQLAVILPFEEAYFRAHRIPATFVGHPLMQSLPRRTPEAGLIDEFRGLGRPLIACLPGSRRHVVNEVLPGQIEVCRRILSRYPDAGFLFAAANDERAQDIRAAIRTAGRATPGSRSAPSRPLPCRIETGRNAEVILAADLVLVASGTATLEVAYYRRPMIVMYNASKWGYRLLARWLIRTPHLSLVNILAGRALVPEFMPYFESIEPIASEALDLLGDPTRRASMTAGLDALVRDLGSHRADEEAAALVLDACRTPSPGAKRVRPGPVGSRHRIW
jgi:lipid-A-disaccharide synthase